MCDSEKMTSFRFAVKHPGSRCTRAPYTQVFPLPPQILGPLDVGELTEPVSQSGLNEGCVAQGKTHKGEWECLRSTAWLEHKEDGSIWNESREGLGGIDGNH